MKIVSQKELGFLPNGTVFSEIIDPEFYKGTDGDMEIDGLCIITGHSNRGELSVENGRFNGCIHMCDAIRVWRDANDEFVYDDEDVKNANDWSMTIDTCEYDFKEDHMFVVYDKEEVQVMADNLQWALRTLTLNQRRN